MYPASVCKWKLNELFDSNRDQNPRRPQKTHQPKLLVTAFHITLSLACKPYLDTPPVKQTQVVAPYIIPQGDHPEEIQIWHPIDVEASQDWWQGISRLI